MHLHGLLPLLRSLPPFEALLERGDEQPQALLAAARAYVVAGLWQYGSGPLLLLTARNEMAQQLAQQLEQWLPPQEEGGPAIHLFADPDALPYERIAWSGTTRQRRLTALSALQSRAGGRPIVVASARALMQKTLPPRELRLALRPLKVGGVVRLDQMTLNWAQTGYNPVDVVEEPGVFARRGGIVDVWPPNLTYPVRIDLFGDEVESLRLFDPATQRTLRNVGSVEIGPGGEALSKYGPAALARLGLQAGGLTALENLNPDPARGSPLQDPALLLSLREELRLEVEHLAEARSFHGIEWYLPYFYDKPGSLLDYAPPEAITVVDDGGDLTAALAELAAQAETLRGELERSGELPHGFAPNYFTVDEMRERLLAAKPLNLGYSDLLGKPSSANTPLARAFLPGPRHGGKSKLFLREIAKLREEGARVLIVTRQAARLQSELNDVHIDAHVQSGALHPPAPRTVSLVQGVANEGFVLRHLANMDAEGRPTGFNSDLHFYTDTELFGWSKPQARRKGAAHSSVAPELFFADVKPGDYVVHIEHGIGQFDGLIRMPVSESEREFLQVSYARGDKLYVPVHQADRLSRYVGASDVAPPITRLGTADWALVKERAKKAVADIAEDLLKLYAEREMATGYAYGPDTAWQEEMEAAFPYQETDDQLAAIDSVKQDMESDRPMDRLIVGDVGFGKTEVAVRAAFKAVMEGKQAAVLVPTTVLAQQHYRTFCNRLANFPIRVEMLSRFRTPAQQRAILDGLLEGSVDIVVGTHALLNKELQFKDLSLLVIDEEQRFGVQQKELLKQLRTSVDVLTLSATPIPRTLHMSLSGVRDMSTINTPPRERQPIHTVLAEYDDNLVRQAVRRELEHGGQVYFVHNRVQGIQHYADKIAHLVPDARVAVGHGQMPERALEETMMRFAEGDIDVLVCTTIIENGLDIPNANTVIINRADHYGLAQLYQLRGRVGRSARRGHCYLLYDKHVTLSFDARRRLQAILESSEELGAGFRIAMRDLEIRGTGDLLGVRQHGHIDSVGFDLYTRLLAQAINDVRRKKSIFEQALKHKRRDGAEDGAAASTGAAEAAGAQAEQPPAAPERAPAPPRREPEPDEAGLEAPFDIHDPLAPPVTLDLPLDAKIPGYYIEDESLRLQMYRRIAGLNSVEAIEEMRKELVDRFGVDPETNSVPPEVDNLLYQIRIKMLAVKAGVQNIGRELDQLVIRAESLENMDRPQMQRRLRRGLGQAADVELDPDEAARVARRAIYLPIDEEGKWRTALQRTLEIMAYG